MRAQQERLDLMDSIMKNTSPDSAIYKRSEYSLELAREALKELERKNKHLTEFVHGDGKTSENKHKESNFFAFNLCNKCLPNNYVVKKVPTDEKELEVELEEI